MRARGVAFVLFPQMYEFLEPIDQMFSFINVEPFRVFLDATTPIPGMPCKHPWNPICSFCPVPFVSLLLERLHGTNDMDIEVGKR